MEYVNSKNIYFLIRDILRFMNPQIMNHGVRVSYIVYKMLECKGTYEEFELADIIMWTSLHDIGVYKTETDGNNKRYELKESMPHSIYGYLFFKYLSPRPDIAKIFLYHHTDYNRLAGCSELEKELAGYINIAERVDIYYKKFGEQFDYKLLFENLIGNKYSEEGVKLFFQAVEKKELLEKLSGGEYESELDAFLEEYMIFSNEEKKQYLEMLAYCMGFSSEQTVVDAVICICVAEAIGQQLMLSDVEQEILYYGSLLHDIGNFGITQTVLKERMKPEVYALVTAHCNSGSDSDFSKDLRDGQISKLQRILRVAEEIVRLQKEKTRGGTKEQMAVSLMEEADSGELNRQIVVSYLANYDEIQEKVKKEAETVLATYRKLVAEYEKYNIRLRGRK